MCAWVGIAAVALGVWTGYAADLRPRRPLPEGVKSPMLALELIRRPDLLDQIARPDENPASVPRGITPRRERAQLVHAIHIDFAFIVAYAGFLILVGVFMWYLPSRLRALGIVTGLFAVIAGASDVVENLAMLALLGGGTVAASRPPSLLKWTMLFIAVAVSTPVFIDRQATMFRRVTGYLGIALAWIAFILGGLGFINHDDKLIEAGAARLGQTFLVAVVFFTTRHALREGVVPALNSLAAKRVFRWITNWPTSEENQVVGEPVDRGL